MTLVYALVCIALILMGGVVLFLAGKAFRAVYSGVPPRAWQMNADVRVGLGWRLAAALGGSIFLVIALLILASTVLPLALLFDGGITHP
jgi:hypothetical protein